MPRTRWMRSKRGGCECRPAIPNSLLSCDTRGTLPVANLPVPVPIPVPHIMETSAPPRWAAHALETAGKHQLRACPIAQDGTFQPAYQCQSILSQRVTSCREHVGMSGEDQVPVVSYYPVVGDNWSCHVFRWLPRGKKNKGFHSSWWLS